MVTSLSPMVPISCDICSVAQKQKTFQPLHVKVDLPCWHSFPKYNVSNVPKVLQLRTVSAVKHQHDQGDQSIMISDTGEKKVRQKSGKKEHHIWQKRDSTGSGQKALHLVQIVSRLPNEKVAVYGALDEWVAWETEFPLIATAKALKILTKRNQWKHIIRVTKWMLSKGQGATLATYDSLLLAFDMDKRLDEAEILWNTILQSFNRSTSRRLFSRMISLYDHHDVPNKVIEVFADMEELGVKPDDDTVKRVAQAFKVLGQEDKQRLVMKKYGRKWKYIHFKGERVRVKTSPGDEIS